MKKSLLALAALTAFAGVASAQSSVTLFGIVDLSARNQKNGSAGDISSLSQDGNASSRLGFRGVEDLGGGLRAGFWIEGALSADTGNATGQTWQRRSTVSLLGSFGEIRLGRDYTPTFWNHTVFDPFGTNGVGSANNLVLPAAANGSVSQSTVLNTPGANNVTSPPTQGTGTFVRANNTIGYFLPAMGGVYGQLMVAAGEGLTGNKYYGGRLGYGAGPINVAAAYGLTDQTGTMVDDLTAWNVGGSYNFGFASLYLQYSQYEYNNRTQKNAMAGVTIPIGAGLIKATYGKVGDAYDAQQFAVGYIYDLSKRTSIYAHAAQIDNEAGNRFVTSPNGPTNTSTGFKSTGYEFGVRHSF